MGAVYWYLYLSGERDVGASFEVGAVQSAIREGRGPMGRGRPNGKGRGLKGSTIIGVPSGREGEANGDELKIASLSRGGK